MIATNANTLSFYGDDNSLDVVARWRRPSLDCIAHGFGKRGLTLSEPVSRDIELSWVEGQTPFSETVRNAGSIDIVFTKEGTLPCCK